MTAYVSNCFLVRDYRFGGGRRLFHSHELGCYRSIGARNHGLYLR